MKVTIITVAYNSADTIRDTVVSVASQDYEDIEYIIIDAASTDNTLSILNEYRSCITKIISEPDSGIYDAMNKGLRFASGKIIGFLNADDFYSNNSVISNVAQYLKKNEFDAVYADLVYVDRSDVNKIVRYWKPGEYTKESFSIGWVMPHPTFFCRKEIYDKYGYYNDSFRIAADFELMLRFVEKHRINLGYLPETIVKMRSKGKANVLSGIIRGNMEIIKSFKQNDLRFSLSFFIKKPITKISQLLNISVRK